MRGYVYDMWGNIKGYKKEDLEVSINEFKNQYMLDTELQQKQTTCKDCTHFRLLPENDFNKKYGCTVSYFEAKYATANTPSCSDFVAKSEV